MKRIPFLVSAEESGQRIDRFLTEKNVGLTRNAIQQLCDKHCVSCAGKPVAKNYKTRAGDLLEIQLPDPKVLEVEPQNIPLDIRYEDEFLLVVNKPKGMVVHPAAGNENGTLVNALLHHCGNSLSGINGVIRPGIVHRIDKDTSGLLVVAKTDAAHQSLSLQIKEHTVCRGYQAVVYGNTKQDMGSVIAPIGRHPIDRKRMAVTDKNSRQAITHYEVECRYGEFTHLKLRLETGRTHQIRVHMAYIGHPVAGDPIYGPKKVIKRLEGQCLHAWQLGFIHPMTGEYLEFKSEPIGPFLQFLSWLDHKHGNF